MKLTGKSGIAKHCNERVNEPIFIASLERLNIFIIGEEKMPHTRAKLSIKIVEKIKVKRYADLTRSNRFAL